jgi:hypothetical protein
LSIDYSITKLLSERANFSFFIFFFRRTGPNVEVKVDGGEPFKGDFKKSQFELKRGESYLFVGAPPKDFKLPAHLKNTTLVGGFEELFVDGRRVGLYDTLVSE